VRPQRPVRPLSPGREAHLGDRVLRRLDGELDEPEDLGVAAAGEVRLRVAPEDRQQLATILPQLTDPDLGLELAQEVLLARGAHEVVVEMAEAYVVQRVLAAHSLVAGLQIDRRVLLVGGDGRIVVVEVAPVDIGVHAAQAVDPALEAAEVDVEDVVDLDAHRLDGPGRERRPARAIGGVDATSAVAGDRDHQVARDRHHRHRLLPRVQADDQHRVRARRNPLAPITEAAVGAEHEDRPRLAGGDPFENAWGDLQRVALEQVEVGVQLEQRSRGNRRRGQQDDDRAAQRELLDHAARQTRRAIGILDCAPSQQGLLPDPLQ
jgi:hypothetical protein